MMKIFANTWAFLRDTRETAFRKLAELGFDGVEIIAHGPCWHADTLDTTERRTASLKLLRELGLDIVAVSPHTEFLAFDQEACRREAEHCMAMVDLALLYGVRLLRIFAGGDVPEGRTRDECVEAVAAGMRPCAEYAEARGVTLAVESHGLFGTDLPALKAVVDIVRSPALGITLDTFNFYENGVNPLDAIRVFGTKIVHTHLKDGLLLPRRRSVALGEGSLDFRAILRALVDAGYRGAYCLEYEGDGDEPYRGLRCGLAHVRGIAREMNL